MVMNPAPLASSKAFRFPASPRFGRVRDRIIIKANHFVVAVADRDLNHYDVSVGIQSTLFPSKFHSPTSSPKALYFLENSCKNENFRIGKRKKFRYCRAMVQQNVQGPSAAYAKEMERLSAKESLLLAVSISPEVSSKKVCREIINQLVRRYKDSHLGKRSLAYDGRKSCYTAGALPYASKDFVVELLDKDSQTRRERKFKVFVKFASKPDLFHLQQFMQGRHLDCPQETIHFFFELKW